MIKKLELKNFQKHKKLELDFSDGVNIIHGKTDTGKSCIVRAIKWIYFGEPKGDVVRKEGTKKTSVKVTQDNGTTVERIKSNSVNAYILRVPGKNKPDRFDAVGRTIPEEVQKALGIDTIKVDKEEIILNIADQISLPFLMDKSGTFRMKLFNQLTGSDIIDKVFQSLNKDILHISKEEKIEKTHSEEQKNQLKELTTKKEKVGKVHNLLITSYNELKKKLSTYDKINDYAKKQDSINKELQETDNKLKSITIIDKKKMVSLDQSIERLDKLNKLLYEIKQNKQELNTIKEKIAELKIPNIDAKNLQTKIEQLNRFRKFITQLKDIETLDKKLIKRMKIASVAIKKDTEKYNQLLKDIKICPFHKKECPLNKERR